jgi:hypothetical protein
MTKQTGTYSKKVRGMARESLELIDAMRVKAKAAKPITGRGVGYKLFTAGLILSTERQEMQRVYRLLKEARALNEGQTGLLGQRIGSRAKAISAKPQAHLAITDGTTRLGTVELIGNRHVAIDPRRHHHRQVHHVARGGALLSWGCGMTERMRLPNRRLASEIFKTSRLLEFCSEKELVIHAIVSIGDAIFRNLTPQTFRYASAK